MRTAPVSFKGYDTSAYAKGMQEILGYTNKDYERVASIASRRQQIRKGEPSQAVMVTKEFLEGARRFFSASINEAKKIPNSKKIK